MQPTHVLSNAEYHQHPALSRSALKYMERSPYHFWYQYLSGKAGDPPPPTPAMAFGTAVHMAVLEPELFLETYAEAPSLPKTTKAGKDAWAEAKATGKELLSKQDMQMIEEIHIALYNHPAAKRALTAPGINEATFIGECPITGLQLKCRPDRLLENGVVIDLKTTQDASASAFSKACANLGYHIQAAFYIHVLHNITGTRPKGFAFLTVEKSAPYGVQLFRCSDSMLAHGHAQMMTQLEELKACKDKYGTEEPWPGYSEKTVLLDLPSWAMR